MCGVWFSKRSKAYDTLHLSHRKKANPCEILIQWWSPPSLYFGVSLPVSIHAHLLVWYCRPFLRDAYIKVLEDEREGTITWSCSEERQNCFLLLMSWPLYLYFTGKCVFPLHKRPLTSIVNYDGGGGLYVLFIVLNWTKMHKFGQSHTSAMPYTSEDPKCFPPQLSITTAFKLTFHLCLF